MIGYFNGTDAFVRHMTIDTSHPGARMNPGRPHLIFRVLHLNHWGFGNGMFPVFESDFFIILVNAVDAETLVPGEGQVIAGFLEIILHVALGTDINPFFPHWLPDLHQYHGAAWLQ